MPILCQGLRGAGKGAEERGLSLRNSGAEQGAEAIWRGHGGSAGPELGTEPRDWRAHREWVGLGWEPLSSRGLWAGGRLVGGILHPIPACSRPRLLRAELAPGSATPPPLRPPVFQLRPACQQVYNLFHPADPSASRLEPLLERRFHALPPLSIPRYQRYPLGDGCSTLLGESPMGPRPSGRVGRVPSPWVPQAGAGPAVRGGASCTEHLGSGSPGIGAGALAPPTPGR